ncbi:hypothetical protein [Hymenobacter psychrophilus]|uniref:LTXXQ motif family protein n=1 Tax=Hymenobacter psychrophilus TaxID=651662 RepID=A0A1H3DAP2_9BACT|nr:hypothetical protein [Hymenobacter psychrophilus]SDX63471.1 hypothetical protein SAMN04488069_102283 [Hymenobacter psychrophilus]
MKAPLLIALLTLTTAPALLAQTAGRPKMPPPRTAAPAAALQLDENKITERATALTANMQKALGLNPQQMAKVGQINLISVRGVETARQTYRQNVRKMGGVIEDIGQARMAQLKEVLSPAQFDKYQRKREEKMGVPSSQGNQGNPVPGMPGQE